MIKATILTKISESGLSKSTQITISNSDCVQDPILQLTPNVEFLKRPAKPVKKRQVKIQTREATIDEVSEYNEFRQVCYQKELESVIKNF